jgi:hypothetical protein
MRYNYDNYGNNRETEKCPILNAKSDTSQQELGTNTFFD